MAPKVNPGLHETWRKRIERQRQSGLTVGEFCGREGVPQANFYLGKRKLWDSGPRPRKRRSSRRTAASPKRQYRKVSATYAVCALPSSGWIQREEIRVPGFFSPQSGLGRPRA